MALTIEHQDILDLNTPALSSTNDLPIVETKPDVSAEPEANKEPETAAPELEKGETTAESATAPESTSADGTLVKKPAQGVQKRLEELVKQREEANERTREANERLDKALKALESATGIGKEPKVEPEQDPEPKRPAKADFPQIEAWEQAVLDYADAKAGWTARKELGVLREKQVQEIALKEIEEGQRLAREAYTVRAEKVKAKYADFHEVAENAEIQVSMPMAHAIIHSENGPELQYYLGKNPAEVARIMQLSPPLQLLELGRIEGRLANDVQAKFTQSAAPKPIKPIAPGATQIQKSPEEESMDEYAARRKRELAVRH